MPELSSDPRAIVDAIQDLTRVTLAVHGTFASRSDTIRHLSELSILPGRIAAILATPPGDVHSALAKAKKRVHADATEKTSTPGPKDKKSPSPITGAAKGEDTDGQG